LISNIYERFRLFRDIIDLIIKKEEFLAFNLSDNISLLPSGDIIGDVRTEWLDRLKELPPLSGAGGQKILRGKLSPNSGVLPLPWET
jgi:hypothetical protein